MSFHAMFLLVSFFGSIAVFVAGLVLKKERPELGTGLWLGGLGYFFLYPIITEILLNIKAFCFRGSLDRHTCRDNLSGYFPIVYSPGYNISFCGLEKLHPFDAKKYLRVFQGLTKRGVLDDSTTLHSPCVPSREFLLELMSWTYLLKLNFSYFICRALEVPLFFMPACLLRINALEPMLRAT